MEILQLKFSQSLSSSSLLFSTSHNLIKLHYRQNLKALKECNIKKNVSLRRLCCKVRAVQTVSETESSSETKLSEKEEDEGATTPSVAFAFVHSVLLPDGTPDVHYRTSLGGKKLRDIMLDNDIELYGPYSRPLLNCGGGGTCGTCIVEVVQGKELLSPRTEKEKEKLKKKPKNWRLACQCIVGTEDSRGGVVIQQLPEWKAHEWTYGKVPPEDIIEI